MPEELNHKRFASENIDLNDQDNQLFGTFNDGHNDRFSETKKTPSKVTRK